MNDAYASAVLADKPIGYWRLNESSLVDEVLDEVVDHSGHRHNGKIVGTPILGAKGAILNSPDHSVTFAPESFIEIPHSPGFSIATSGQGLTVEVWMRPDELSFPTETGTNYVHWLGKGESGRMEWGFRFYRQDAPKVSNRISAYAWNPSGGLGAGAYCPSDLVRRHEWLHLVACFEHYVDPCIKKTGVQMWVNGEVTNCPPSRGTLYFNEGHWTVVPRGDDAPLRFGTRSAKPGSNSFLTGGIDEVAIYPLVLSETQIKRHYDLARG